MATDYCFGLGLARGACKKKGGQQSGQAIMNNYLQGFGRSVGFADDTDRRDAPREQGETEWEAVSLAGSHGEVNILRGAWGRDRVNLRGEGTGPWQGTTTARIHPPNGTGNSHGQGGATSPGQSRKLTQSISRAISP